jgi:hypothetical protein
MNGGHPGSHRAFARFEIAFAVDQGDMADPDSGHVGYGIEGAWLAGSDSNAEIAQSRLNPFRFAHAAGSYAAVIIP